MRRQAFGLGGGADAREVDVRGEVLLAGLLAAMRARRPAIPGRPLVCRAKVVSVPAACAGEYSSRAS